MRVGVRLGVRLGVVEDKGVGITEGTADRVLDGYDDGRVLGSLSISKKADEMDPVMGPY